MNRTIAAVLGMAFATGIITVAPAAYATSLMRLPIDPDEQAVYEAVLNSWLGEEQKRQLIDTALSAPPAATDPELRECAVGARFRSDHAGSGKSLSDAKFDRKGIELVDGSQWQPFNQDRSIAEGKSIDEAVDKSFAQALISFSQIAFSHDREDALVNFRMACGPLCGSGLTMRLHKSGGRWSVAKRCAGYLS